MTTIRGRVTKREIRTAGAAADVLMTVQPAQGPSIPVIWRGAASFVVGDVIEASGELDTDAYLVAASVNKVGAAPRPFPWWILAVAGVVLIAGGVTLWKLAGTRPAPQPPAPAPTPPAPAPTPPAPPTGPVSIMNRNSHLCLSPAGGARDNNVEIVQFTCDGDPSRVWTFRVVENDIVQIVNANSVRCLTVAGGNKEPNDPSVQYNCDTDLSRRWQYVPVDATTFRLKNVNSQLCLTIAGGGTGNNQTAVQYACDGDPSRDWQIYTGH
jgi:cytolethal distending toxin subunit A